MIAPGKNELGAGRQTRNKKKTERRKKKRLGEMRF